MKLIGIHGKARSGKDEVTHILSETYGFKRVSFADKIRDLSVIYFNLSPDELRDHKTKFSREILQGIGSTVRNRLFDVEKQFVGIPEKGISKFPKWVEEIAIEEFKLEPILLPTKRKEVKTILNGIINMFNENLDDFLKVIKSHQTDIWINYLFDNYIKNKSELIDYVLVIPDIRYKNEMKKIKDLGGKTIKIERVDNPPIEAGSEHESENDLIDEMDWDFILLNEHKTDWRDKLELGCANMVRKFVNESFFDSNHITNFKIKLGSL